MPYSSRIPPMLTLHAGSREFSYISSANCCEKRFEEADSGAVDKIASRHLVRFFGQHGGWLCCFLARL